MLQGSLLLYCRYIIRNEDLLTPLIGTVQGCAFLSLPFWIWISKERVKQFAYNIAAIILSVTMLLLTFNSSLVVCYILASILGICLIVVYLIPYSM